MLAEALDPEPERVELAHRRYRHICDWIEEHGANAVRRDIRVYVQGSGRLGTTNRNPDTGEFDLDLVIRVAHYKDEIPQAELNAKVGGWLGSYCSAMNEVGGEFSPSKLENKGRAWTLTYDDAFHIDVLPVVLARPGELVATGGEPSWLTDRDLYYWQPTNPLGFATFFDQVSGAGQLRVEKRADVQIDPLPDHSFVKTDLQRAVQIVKRHKDLFSQDPKTAAPSALITACMAMAHDKYVTPSMPFDAVVRTLVDRFEELLEEAGGELSVPNPHCPTENYADRYAGDEARKAELKRWVLALRLDLATLSTTSRIPEVKTAISKSFGPSLGDAVVQRAESQMRTLRINRALGTTAIGQLGVATDTGTRTNPGHDFYGR
jgi:hypothetical protein